MGRVRARPLLVYDPAWPDLFEAEAAAIRGALAPAVVAVEHVGSTSIEGMTAKPVIDILLGLHRRSYPIANGVRFARSATSGEHVDRQSGSTSARERRAATTSTSSDGAARSGTSTCGFGTTCGITRREAQAYDEFKRDAARFTRGPRAGEGAASHACARARPPPSSTMSHDRH